MFGAAITQPRGHSYGKSMATASKGTVLMLTCTSGQHNLQQRSGKYFQSCANSVLKSDGHAGFGLQKAQSSLLDTVLIAFDTALILECQEFAPSNSALSVRDLGDPDGKKSGGATCCATTRKNF